jgi:hypothetical protein
MLYFTNTLYIVIATNYEILIVIATNYEILIQRGRGQ